MEDARNLKFKSEILPRDFAEWIIKFRRTRLCSVNCRYALKFHYVLVSRYALKFCRSLKFNYVLKHCRAALKFYAVKFLCGGILSFKFYKLSTPPCVHRSSIYRILSVKFEREILKFRVAVISGILCRNSIAKTHFKRRVLASCDEVL